MDAIILIYSSHCPDCRTINNLLKKYRIRVTGLCIDNVNVRKQVMESRRYVGISSVPTIVITYTNGLSKMYSENDAISRIIEIGQQKQISEAERGIKREGTLLKGLKLPPREQPQLYTYTGPNNMLVTVPKAPQSEQKRDRLEQDTVDIGAILAAQSNNPTIDPTLRKTQPLLQGGPPHAQNTPVQGVPAVHPHTPVEQVHPISTISSPYEGTPRQAAHFVSPNEHPIPYPQQQRFSEHPQSQHSNDGFNVNGTHQREYQYKKGLMEQTRAAASPYSPVTDFTDFNDIPPPPSGDQPDRVVTTSDFSAQLM